MRVGPYELLAQVGAGPDGAAYRARRDGAEGFVEVLTLAAARQDEARWDVLGRRLLLARLLEHPLARRVLDLDLRSDPPWAALEAAAPESLGRQLQGRLPLPASEGVRVALELVGVLAEAHRLGLGHGRLGPAAVGCRLEGLQVDFTGALVREEGPALPPVGAGAMAADVVDFAGLLAWLLGGRLARPGDPLPGMPPLLGALVGEVLRAPPEERPSLVELAGRLRQAAWLEEQGRLARTNVSARQADAPPPAEQRGAAGVGPADGVDSPLLQHTRVIVGEPAPPPAGFVAGRERLGRFRLLEKLGQGGMGEVYRAEDVSTGAVVAVKTLLPELAGRPEAFARFRKEARLLAEVNNPYVANLLEVNEDDGVHYLAVEFVAGRSLVGLLGPGKVLPEAFALAVAADVCRALIDAHARGIIHRDIKPANILLVADPEGGSAVAAGQVAKLSDFGLARHVVESDSLQMTQTGAVVGTPLYLSPEQCMGRSLDARSDVYGLGATLFHLLAGRPPFTGDGPLALIHQHCNAPPPDLQALRPGLSDGACRVVTRALAKSPAQRHADAGEMLRDIERVLRGEPAAHAAHPLLPAGNPARVLLFDFCWQLAASPAELWPHVSNTERLNRAIRLPAVQFTTKVDEAGAVRREGRFRKMGVEVSWDEHPFEWVEARRFGVLRQCHAGPLKWLVSAVELEARAGGGTTLRHRIRVEPAGLLGRAFAAVEVGVRTRRALGRVYRRIDAAVAARQGKGGLIDPFEEAALPGRPQQRRLDEALDGLAARGLDPTVVERLGAYVATAPAQEAARIRPLALARQLDLSADAVLAACLHGAREGLLGLRWDLLCPLCRIPSGGEDTLKALRGHGRCEACNADYELDFGASVELVFRAHPSIREVELRTYCVGGPAHSPHVVAQVRVAGGERVELDLDLAEGAYRLRGPQLPAAQEARVEPGAPAARWDVVLARPGEQWAAGRCVRLRPGGQVLAVHNPHPMELVVRLERTAARDDAVTAARAAAMALFRELFPGEVLSPGRLMSLSAVTLVQTALVGLPGMPEAEAFARLHEHLTRAAALARQAGGALVKAVGDGALAAFHEPAAAVRAVLEMRREGGGFAAALHRGPALAATVNDHLDYFGATVRQVAAMLAAAGPGEAVLSQALMDDPLSSAVLREGGLVGRVEAAAGLGVVHRFAAAQ
jgi:class 3 adenylate cyclase